MTKLCNASESNLVDPCRSFSTSAMLFSLAALPLTFTAPSAHLAVQTRAPAASMVLIGLKPLEWPKEDDASATLGDFVHTRVAAPATTAPCVPVDSVPRMIGLAPSTWPDVYDKDTNMNEFVHTRVAAPATVAPSVPVDSVPRMIGMSRRAWPDVYDKDTNMNEFVLTRVAAPASTSAPKVRGPIIGMSRGAWPTEYGDRADPTDPTATLGGFVHTRVISTDATGKVVPTPAAPFVKAVAEEAAEAA